MLLEQKWGEDVVTRAVGTQIKLVKLGASSAALWRRGMAHLVQGKTGCAGKDLKSQGRRKMLSKLEDVEETGTKLPEFCWGRSQGVAHRAFLPTGYPDTHWGLRSLLEMLPPFKSAPTYGRLLILCFCQRKPLFSFSTGRMSHCLLPA